MWHEEHFIFRTPYYAVPHKNISKKLKLRLNITIIDKMLTYASETWILTKRDRKQTNIFERKVYRRILDPVHDNESENWRIFTTEEFYATVKKPTITETIRLNRSLVWACTENGRKQNSQNGITHEFRKNKTERQTKKQTSWWSEGGLKNSLWRRVAGKSI